MPTYFYKAKNLKGEEETGILESSSPSFLAKTLREKGYFLISAEIEGEVRKGKKINVLKRFFNFLAIFLERFWGISSKEKLFFTKNLEVMIKTGVSLPRAFELLARQTKSKKFKKVLGEIAGKIIKGKGLSESLKSCPEVFPVLYQETLKIGEETGKLEESLKILSNQIEREYNLRARIKAAMIYPMVVLCLAFLIGILMMFFAVPKLRAVFEELNVELPFTTQIFLSLADFLIKKWPLAILIVALLIFVLVSALKTKKGGKLKGILALKIPLLSKIVRETNSALALRTLSSLLKAGVPILHSLEVVAGAQTNFYFKKSLEEAGKEVEKGRKISEALKPYENLYSPMVLQMMEIGEETGETPEVLMKLADFYEEEVTATTQKLSSVIEPFLIIIIGGIVGFFAISMFQPMFSIMGGM
ncbi:MAG: type II secretion system F family protein [Patescibacteria group bacterium]|nr:type II secretion system F family protein [Patescibacteria group bacterium]